MAKKDSKKHNWKKAQPHSSMSGKIVSRSYARTAPRKVAWVSAKRTRAR
ncbi:hypothetical protein KW797_01600 [Candidatus Parcubacteria bacterium]|nr:hypothetical protein [Candidatus Parcubacteria bacterium]